MANAGHIFVKNGVERPYNYRDFYGPMDKGSAKPSFCYPKRKEALEDEVSKTEKALENGYIAKEREMEARITLKTKKKRLDDINTQESDAKKIFAENPDFFIKRRAELAKDIRSAMPTRNDVSKRRVNPFKVLQTEKSGLEEKKREFVILSRLAGEDSNTSFLQRD
jgi:hypothetical protein